MLIQGSRDLKEWLYGHVEVTSSNDVLAASSVDRYTIFFLLIVGVIILAKRSVAFQSIAANWAICLFFLYALCSIVWSDFRMESFVAWHRMLLSLLMVLVVCSEQEPVKAFNALLRRCAYVLVPWSVILIKYYPDTGRYFSVWGIGQNVGVTNSKNKLGALCLVTGLFFLSSYLAKRRYGLPRIDRRVDLVMLGLVGWLIYGANSSNATLSIAFGITLLVCLQLMPIRKNFGTFLLVMAPIGAFLLATTGLYELIISSVGRDTTLTGRTELWADLAKIPNNPLIGAGFESFWMGDRIRLLWQKLWWHPNEAHNAYYEMYLNLGFIGLLLQLAMIVSSYFKASGPVVAAARGERAMTIEEDIMWQYRLVFVLAITLYGWAEAAFRGSSFMFFTFLFVSIELVAQRQVWKVPSTFGAARSRPATHTSFEGTHAIRRIGPQSYQ
jgi:hypothetical protein